MIRTERLLLRAWRAEDAPAHNAMCRDPAVSATLGPVPTIEGSGAAVERQNRFLAEHGHCFWALEHKGAFGGWCGLKPGAAPIENELEIGWSLRPDLWGRGLVTEAATACLAFAWERTAAPAVVAITSVRNGRSLAVMRRLGMRRREGGEFDHPALTADSPLLRHVTFELARPARG